MTAEEIKEMQLKDRGKTQEINRLTAEARQYRAALEEALQFVQEEADMRNRIAEYPGSGISRDGEYCTEFQVFADRIKQALSVRPSAEPAPPVIKVTKAPDGFYTVHFAQNGKYLGDFLADADGDYYFWPDKSGQGAWADYVLEAIARELGRLNKEAENGQIES